MSDVLFARNHSANLLQLSRGLALFATNADHSIYRIGSRFGNNPAYNTVSHALETLSGSGQEWLRAVADSDEEWLMFIIDNVQHYARQREIRDGREDTMIKGVTGTGVRVHGGSPAVWDFDAWKRRRESGLRYSVTVPRLLEKIDFEHLALVSTLHWVDVLISGTSSLALHKRELEERFERHAKPLRMPLERSIIQPLQSNASDPAQTTGMHAALLDFFSKQLNQTSDRWKRRVTLVGGDGGTFEMLLRLQKYLQTLPTEYDRMEWLVPVLQLWHMKWTALGRIVNNWWGSATSPDASCLGNSAKVAGKKTPSNLKKPDFHSGMEMVFLVGEARMLDCWR